MNDMRGFDAAQRAYDNMTPDDGVPLCECPDCNCFGWRVGEEDTVKCATCDGHGWLLDGEPYDKHAADIAAEQAAERRMED